MKYRVLTRTQAAALVVTMLGIAALIFWSAVGSIESYVERIADVDDLPPDEAIDALTTRLKVVAVAQAVPLIAFCAFMIWYCRKAIRTRALPPAGSWIVEGQRVRTGTDAVKVARMLMVLTAALAVLGVLAMVYTWRLALALRDAGAGV